MAVHQIQQRLGRIGDHGPERHPRRARQPEPDPAADARRSGPARCRWCPTAAAPIIAAVAMSASAPDERARGRSRICIGAVSSPSTTAICAAQTSGSVGDAAAAGGDDDAKFGQVIRDHEHLGKRRMRQIGRRRGQHQFGVGGHVDLARLPAGVGQGDAPRLGIIFGRDDDFGAASSGAARDG